MMKDHRTQAGILGLFLLFLVVGLCLATCSEAPFAPKNGPGSESPTVYIYDPTGDPLLLLFNPDSMALDSVYIPWFARFGITVSADGKRLYFAQDESVVVVDTDSFSVITELPYNSRGPVAVSPDNQLVAVTGDDLYILDANDYSVMYYDTAKAHRGQFSRDGRSFFCVSSSPEGDREVVYEVDCSNGIQFVQRKFFEDGSVLRVVPTPDGSKWLLYLTVALWTSAFEVYDVEQDSIIYRELLIPGMGDIAVTPDGHKAFYTNPGTNSSGPPAPLAFTVFDLDVNAVDTVIEDQEFFSTPGAVAVPNRLTITPDSKWLVILGGDWVLLDFFMYDIEHEKLVYDAGYLANLSHVFANASVQLWQ
jgi:DNA-binding beta-propeller fold protein YncE